MTETDIANLAISHFGGKPLVALSTDQSAQAVAARKWFAPARDEALRSHPWNFARKRGRLTTSYTALSGVALAASGDGEIVVDATAHGLTTGMRVYMKDVEGVTGANGRWHVTRIDDDSFVLDDTVFSGSHTSGTGSWVRIPLFGWDFWHDEPEDCLKVLRCNGEDGATDDGEDFEIENGKILSGSDEINLSYIYQNTTTAEWTQDFINAFSYLLASFISEDLTGGKSQALRQVYEKLVAPNARMQDARESKPKTPPAFYQGSLLYRARFGSCTP